MVEIVLYICLAVCFVAWTGFGAWSEIKELEIEKCRECKCEGGKKIACI